jgi:acetamidase/formamidase
MFLTFVVPASCFGYCYRINKTDPVEVDGGLLSMGDAHAAQGDSELDGTGIETSITGRFRVTVIKKENFTPAQTSLDFPLGETEKDWMVHGSVIFVACIMSN